MSPCITPMWLPSAQRPLNALSPQMGAWATATLKHLLPIKQKRYGGDWLSGPWANHTTTKPPFLTLCCVSAYYHADKRGSHPLQPLAALSGPLHPTSRTLPCQGVAASRKGSLDCAADSLHGERCGFRSPVSCSFVSASWINSRPRFGALWTSSVLQFLLRFLVSGGIGQVENLTLSILTFGISRQTGKHGRVRHNVQIAVAKRFTADLKSGRCVFFLTLKQLNWFLISEERNIFLVLMISST